MTILNDFEQVARNPEKRLRVYNVLSEASLAKELGGDWQMILRKAKNRRAGAKRRIYEFVNTGDRIDIVLKGISGEITNLSI